MKFLTIIMLLLSLNHVRSQSLDLTIKGNGISIGDSRRINGLRLNFRDRRLRQVNGVNMTIWMPHDPARGTVKGIALGLPLTGADRISGLAVGVFGLGAEQAIQGIGIAPIGLGAGESLSGIMIGGIGIGAGKNISGVSIGGIGVGAGRNISGLNLAILGLGAGGNITGISFATLGVGAGKNITGITAAGLGLGAGGEIKGIAAAVVGVGASNLTGLVTAFAAGCENFRGLAMTPGYFRITKEGIFNGVAIGGFHDIRGEHRGLSIGILNIANDLRGVQIGLINIAKSNPTGLKVLPVFNADFN